jgi:hypothetical protein
MTGITTLRQLSGEQLVEILGTLEQEMMDLSEEEEEEEEDDDRPTQRAMRHVTREELTSALHTTARSSGGCGDFSGLPVDGGFECLPDVHEAIEEGFHEQLRVVTDLVLAIQGFGGQGRDLLDPDVGVLSR